MEQQHKYVGQELAFFEKAFNWKSYFASLLKPYIGINVLEVGSGIGATTKLLNDGSAEQWTLLEPDPELFQILKQRMSDGSQYSNCILKNQTISGIEQTGKF